MSIHPAEQIVVFGAGGQAKVTRDAIQKHGGFRITAYVVDDRDVAPGERFLGTPLYPLEELLHRQPLLARHMLVAIGDNATRASKMRKMQEFGFRAASIVHPAASVACGVELGEGVMISAGAILDPDVVIGEGALVNCGACIAHESRIGDYAHISVGALIGGNCVIGDLAFVGLGAKVLSGITIGRNAFIAAGALVTKDVPDGVLAIGTPARFRVRQPA